LSRPSSVWQGAVGLLMVTTFGVSNAHAAGPVDVGPPSDSPTTASSGIEQSSMATYWQRGRVRPFLAATFELGFAYLRPQLAAGYGRPHWLWAGVEAYPVASPSGFGQYFGIRGALPFLSLRAGARYYRSFDRTFLEIKETYDRLDLDTETGRTSQYLAIEGEALGTIPLPVGNIFAVATGYYVRLLPNIDRYVFEESLHVVMAPPYVWRTRLGYAFGLGPDGAIRLGVAGDIIGLPERDEIVVRAGVIGSVVMTQHIDAQVSFIPVWLSPDTLGLAGGDFGQLGVRFRFATDSDSPNPAGKRASGQ